MSATRLPSDELIKAVEEQHARYLKTLRDLHETLHANDPERSNTAAISAGPTGFESSPPSQPFNSPTLNNDSFPLFQLQPARSRVRRLTNEDSRRVSATNTGLTITSTTSSGKNVPVSLHSYDPESSDDELDYALDFLPLLPAQPGRQNSDTERWTIQTALPAHAFTEDQLLNHLTQSEFSAATQTALDDVYQRRLELNSTNLFTLCEEQHDKMYGSAAYEVFEVGRDGMAVAKHGEDENNVNEILEAFTVWNTIKEVNPRGTATGNLTCLMDPSPLMLGAVHMTMATHFDMDELFQHLVTMSENTGKTKAYVNRAFESSSIRQRSFFFVFKYYTVVAPGTIPAPWQQYDYRPASVRSQDHIDISECSSILALSLSGPPRKTVNLKKKKGKAQQGKLYDTFAPWHLLNIQSFPDDEHIIRGEESRKYFPSGPYAFLDALVVEYKDAVKRNIGLNELISKLITPPIKFMFNVGLRDELLFEDKNFTYSRRYFWAYNTLGVINDGIKSMIAAYTDTFTSTFWAGRHPTLFPLFPGSPHDPDLPAGKVYLESLAPIRAELETAIAELKMVYTKNEETRQEIKSLRDQLFAGSSVRESRRAIEQGDNIKILTSLSMIFLPLTFVTSVWSMTGFPLSVEGWQFPLTMVAACVPFCVFVALLQTRTGSEAFRRAIEKIDARYARWRADMEQSSKRRTWFGHWRGKRKLLLPMPVTAGGHTDGPLSRRNDKDMGNGNMTDGKAAPRRKRRFSRRVTVADGTHLRGESWWRFGKKVEDSLV